VTGEEGGAMYETRHEDTVSVIRGIGELSREELASIARLAADLREAGRTVVIDLKRVTHLHYAGAALLKAIPGLRASGATRYVRDLVCAGGAGGHVEMYADVAEAIRAA
jgi:ABC-type transporter Mla MlaB component